MIPSLKMYTNPPPATIVSCLPDVALLQIRLVYRRWIRPYLEWLLIVQREGRESFTVPVCWLGGCGNDDKCGMKKIPTRRFEASKVSGNQ